MNKLLIHVLAQLCALDLGKDGWHKMDMGNLPRNWPNHFLNTIRILNCHILPSLKFSPKELLLGLVINTPKTSIKDSTSTVMLENIEAHMAYVDQQWVDTYSEAIQHVDYQKDAFNWKVLKSKAGPVIFHTGQLVQVFCSDLAYSIRSEQKLTPMWSTPHQVTEHPVNSYKLEMLDDSKLKGEFSVHRLREFIPREGMELAEAQQVHMKWVNKEEAEWAKREKEVEGLWRKESECGMVDIVGPGFFYEGDGNEEEIEGERTAERVVRQCGHHH
jgi:hypothetical protein